MLPSFPDRIKKSVSRLDKTCWHRIYAAVADMENNFDLLSGTRSQISVLELKRLLIEIKAYRPDICVRYRLLGELWNPSFMKVLLVTERGILLSDEPSNRLISLADLSMVMQFEMDNRFRDFQPHFHYEVIPSSEFSR